MDLNCFIPLFDLLLNSIIWNY